MTKPKKEPKPILIDVYVQEISTGAIICHFPPTEMGERRANRYQGLSDLQIIKKYNAGGNIYESN